MPHVYLVQPATLVGTNRYKVGMSSKNDLNRVKSYGSGTRYLCIFEQDDAVNMERKLLKVFRSKFNLIAGKEYFIVDIPEADMVTLFISIVMGTYTDLSKTLNRCINISTPNTCHQMDTIEDNTSAKDSTNSIMNIFTCFKFKTLT